MLEQELKLHVPEHQRQRVKKALNTAESITLRAMYFDTEDRQLAKASVSLRLRLEGNDWVQTLKMAGENTVSRIEINHNRPNPILDLSLYAGTVAEPILSNLNQPLALRYETDITRLFKKQRTRKGTVEICFDTGVARAGQLELPIHEIEFELKSGKIGAIFDVALRWLKNYDLILDLRTKAHRGDALANMMAKINAADEHLKEKIEAQEMKKIWAERKANAYFIPKNANATQALCKVTQECVEQMISNAAMLAEIDTAGVIATAKAEHIHQLRIGMRRLASNWKLFNKHAHLPDEGLQAQLKMFLASFGATRDTDVMLETIMPSLKKAGMPPIEIEHYQGCSGTELARENSFQTFLVKLLEWIAVVPTSDPIMANEQGNTAHPHTMVEEPPVDVGTLPEPLSQEVEASHRSDTSTPTPFLDIIPLIPSSNSAYSLRKVLEKRLNTWHKSIVSHWRYHDINDIEAYHDLRKKIKRIRYGLNVYEGLEGHAKLKGYVKRLAKNQEVFGRLNDASTALTYFASIAKEHPQAWFAVGWLSAQLDGLKKEADIALKQLPRKLYFY